MGPGWRARTATHAAEVLQGSAWRNYCTDNEVEPLRAVLLTWPGDELAFDGEPADWLMSERPDLPKMRQQAENIATYYESVGAKVHWIRPREAAPPNLVFACDLATMTPEGAILSRMAAQQRAGEERFAALALAEAGVPLLGMPTGTATLEGADVMWLNPDLVLVGTGIRTNEAGFLYVRELLASQDVIVSAVPLNRTVQHLLGTVNLLNHELCVTYDPSPELVAELDNADIRRLDFARPAATGASAESQAIFAEVTQGRALNFVTVAPNHIVMPAGCARVRALLQQEGVRCDELDVSEYIRAEGALGCLTGILAREPARRA